ncbi:hypothetical protein [Streptococcus pluranimalium]
MKNSMSKIPSGVIVDTTLSYFLIGRLMFEEEGYMAYVISEWMHIDPSDV